MSRRGAGVLWVAAGVALLVLAGSWNLAAGIRQTDEAWFLQVVARVRGGESLYREVFFGSTPLAVWLAVAASHVAGLEIGVIKALRVGCFVASALIAARLVLRMTGRTALAMLLLGAALLWAAPDPKALYSPLAELLLLVTAALGIHAYRRDREDPSRGSATHWLAPGLAAGLCIGAKYNTGAYAAIALAGAALLAGGRPRAVAGRLAVLGGAVAGVLVVIAGLIAADGGFAAFVDHALAGKRGYLERAPIPYGDGLRALAESMRPSGIGTTLSAWFSRQAFLLAPLAGLLAAAAIFRTAGSARRELLLLALFALASFATLFPRADHGHLVHAVLALLVLGACAWQGLRASLRTPLALTVEIACGVWIASGLLVGFVEIARPVVRGELVWSTLPRLGGSLITEETQERIATQASGMAEALGPEAFVVSSRAGFWYLITGVRNPTPWDWPGVTSMGARGQEAAIERIRRGEIERVCLDTRDWGLNPQRLEQAVAAHLEPVRDLGPCVFHRRARAAPPAGP